MESCGAIVLTGSPPAHHNVDHSGPAWLRSGFLLQSLQLTPHRFQIETSGRAIATIGRDAAFQQLPQSCDLLGFGFAHARSLRAAFSIVNGRNLLVRFQLADIGPIHAMLPAVDASCPAQQHCSVQPALWRESSAIEPRRCVWVWSALCAVTHRAMTDSHVNHDAIASL